MKKQLFFSLSFLLILGLGTFYQFSPSEVEGEYCCTVENFADLANDPAFMAQHENPLWMNYDDLKGKMISFKASDGNMAKGYFIKAKKKSNKYLLVFQEWWGLNEHIKKEADKYYGDLEGVNVLALDLYDGKVATTQQDAGKYMQAADEERIKAIIEGAMKLAGKKAEFATVGWCFGGGWSLKASLITGDKAKACVMYYGMPVKEVETLKTLQTEVLGIFAKQDKWINPEVVGSFEENMESAGKELEVKMYDADHAFANPSNPKYEKEYADEAYTMSLNFIKERL